MVHSAMLLWCSRSETPVRSPEIDQIDFHYTYQGFKIPFGLSDLLSRMVMIKQQAGLGCVHKLWTCVSSHRLLDGPRCR